MSEPVEPRGLAQRLGLGGGGLGGARALRVVQHRIVGRKRVTGRIVARRGEDVRCRERLREDGRLGCAVARRIGDGRLDGVERLEDERIALDGVDEGRIRQDRRRAGLEGGIA